MNEILVHNNWDPLEEIWLGDVWPAHFYDDLEPEIRDSFYQLTEWTKQDLDNVEKKLKEFNVVVKRPYVDGDKSLYLDPTTNKLLKPPIGPRDYNAVVGDKLFFGDHGLKHCYESLLKDYPQENIIKDQDQVLEGSGLVKLGKDIIVDGYIEGSPLGIEGVYRDFYLKQKLFKMLSNDYRIHYATNGGHTDGCFMPIKEGLLLATKYWSDYELMFPGWKTFNLDAPTYQNQVFEFNGMNRRWILPNDPTGPHFNKYIEEYCREWVGDYRETYFEVNIIMLDENNMLCMGEHPSLFKELEKHGITCHVVPFRTRGFWDGGVHCITLDIRRKAVMKDYFPDRGETGIASVLTQSFKNNAEPFLSEYKKFEDWVRDTGQGK